MSKLIDLNNPVRRLAAWTLDYLVIAGYLVVLTAVSIGILASGLHKLFASAWSSALTAEVMGFVLLTLPVVLYFAFCEASSSNATLGKRALGLRVLQNNGDRLGLRRSLLRSALKFLPWELAHFSIWQFVYGSSSRANPPTLALVSIGIVYLLVAAYLVTLFVGRSHRTIYDRIAGTRVS